MVKAYEDVLRCAVAVQVAVYELLDEDITSNQAIKALDAARVELNASVRRLKKEMEE